MGPLDDNRGVGTGWMDLSPERLHSPHRKGENWYGPSKPSFASILGKHKWIKGQCSPQASHLRYQALALVFMEASVSNYSSSLNDLKMSDIVSDASSTASPTSCHDSFTSSQDSLSSSLACSALYDCCCSLRVRSSSCLSSSSLSLELKPSS